MSEGNAAPKRSFGTYDARVDRVELITPTVRHIVFRFNDGKDMAFKAGQFIQVHVPLPDGQTRRTSYSIASPPRGDGTLDLCVTHVPGGKSSTFLHGLKPGDPVRVMGPLGKFVLPDALPRDTAFIATGSGVAPFRSMIHDLAAKGTDRRVKLIFGNRYEPDILYRREWEDLAKAFPRFEPLFTLSRADASWAGERGYVQEKIANVVPNPAEWDYLICGLVKMIDGVVAKLKELGVPESQIHYERYD